MASAILPSINQKEQGSEIDPVSEFKGFNDREEDQPSMQSFDQSQISMRSGLSKFGRTNRSNSKNSYASRKSGRFTGLSKTRVAKI